MIEDLAELMRETYAEITGDASFLSHPIEEISGEKFYGEGYEDCDRRVPNLEKARAPARVGGQDEPPRHAAHHDAVLPRRLRQVGRVGLRP